MFFDKKRSVRMVSCIGKNASDVCSCYNNGILWQTGSLTVYYFIILYFYLFDSIRFDSIRFDSANTQLSRSGIGSSSPQGSIVGQQLQADVAIQTVEGQKFKGYEGAGFAICGFVNEMLGARSVQTNQRPGGSKTRFLSSTAITTI